MDYDTFIERKKYAPVNEGIEVDREDLIRPNADKVLKPFQTALVHWALKRGRAALFEDTGLGKTGQQAIWCDQICRHTDVPVLIMAPLAVAHQTIAEALSFGVRAEYVRAQSQIDGPGVYVTNYEMESEFDPAEFAGICLDESSILKSKDGKTRTSIIERWGAVPYRLSCTATPSPNDHAELGSQAQFLGIMSVAEMLAQFFTHDGGETQKWVLKGHGRKKFWEWMSTWAAFVRKPSDIGFSDEGYDLPGLNLVEHDVSVATEADGQLFAMPAQTLQDRRKAKKSSIMDRVDLAASLVNDSSDSWLVWCHLNDEQDALEKAIDRNHASVRGSDKQDKKEDGLLGFADGRHDVLISKPSIAGFGMNYQHSHNMVFVGLDDSFEKFYQAVRRQFRFGQIEVVNSHIISTDAEDSIKKNLERKMQQHEEMAAEMVEHMREFMQKEIGGAYQEKTEYEANQTMEIPAWLK